MTDSTLGVGEMVWIDLETSDLEPDMAWSRILEIGIVVTDRFGTVIRSYTGMPRYSEFFLGLITNSMPKVVRDMHDRSGLLNDLRQRSHGEAAEPPANAEQAFEAEVREALDSMVGHVQHKVPMAGASVHFDRRWLKHHMPNIEDGFHYRNFDISTIRMAVQNLRPDLMIEEPNRLGLHRALPDIFESVSYYRWAQEHFFRHGV